MSSGKIGIFFYREHTLITGVHVHLCKLSNEARTCAGSWYKPLRHLKKKNLSKPTLPFTAEFSVD